MSRFAGGTATRRIATGLFVVVALPLVLSVATGTPAVAGCGIDDDVNGDGHADLVVGEPGHNPFGGMRVIYGSAAGLQLSDTAMNVNQYFDLRSPGLPPTTASWGFGSGIATGDFDGDCRADVATGASLDDGLGGVVVLYGSSSGLTTAGSAAFAAADLLPDGPSSAPHIGSVMAAGDFNGDGRDDLAVGTLVVPGVVPSVTGSIGGVVILYGGPDGLSVERRRLITQNTPGVPGVEEDPDRFGSALAAGDFDADGRDDLAVGSPGEWIGAIARAGSVTVIPGTSDGLTGAGSTSFHQGTPGVPGANEAGDAFGGALASGDVTGDGHADLVVASPRENVDPVINCGVITLLKGTSSGLTAAGAQLWHQNSAGVPGTNEAGDIFGEALATGDLNGDGRMDAVIGVPHERIGGSVEAGAVFVLYGAASGLTAGGTQTFSQRSAGVAGTPEYPDHFGWAVHAVRLGTGTTASLVIGSPHERFEPGNLAWGMIHVLRGTASGVTSASALDLRAADLVPGGVTTSTLPGAFGASLG
jgi:hypothetical protein